MKKYLKILLMIIFLSSLSFSQFPTSDMSGKVTLEDGSFLPGVLITLTSKHSEKKTTRTSPEGHFLFSNLSPGNYNLEFELKGFHVLQRKDIRISAGKDVNLSVQMQSAQNKKTKRIAANKDYRAGVLTKFLLGKEYRRLWVEPIEVEVFNLQTEAGGLTPVMRVGGHQTKGLALEGANGRAYTFRGVNKDPSVVLPPFLIGTIADRAVQDQMSSAYPAGPLVAETIMEAAGLLAAPVRFVIMPDDPALGEFQREFAGLFGTIQEYPTPASDKYSGFANATEILNYQEMWRRLQTNPANRVDSQVYLRARLVDIFIGDWDRHRRQWRWARMPGKELWQPIPEDRDQAFTRYDGLIPSIGRFGLPFILNFGKKYSGINGLTFAGWDVDRYLLTDLEKKDWITVASDLKTRLTDSVIESAVRRLPPEYYRLDGARLEAALKNRRDHLLEITNQYYHHLARKVDIYMTHKAELAEIVHIMDNATEIRISLLQTEGSQAKQEPYYKRRFHHNETQEIRLHLLGGDDMVISKGGPFKGITLRIIGIMSHFTVDDSKGGNLTVYDSSGMSKIIQGPGTRLNKRVYIPSLVNPSAPWIPPRDWGRHTIPSLWFGAGPDLGLFLGGGFSTTVFGFRSDPFSSRQSLKIGYATTPNTFRLDYKGEYHPINTGVSFNLSSRASGIEILYFHGFGNETSSDAPKDFYKIQLQRYSFDPSITIPISIPMSITFGTILQFSITDLEQQQDRLIGILEPYGTGKFGQLGIFAAYRYDLRNSPRATSQGFLLSLEGRYFPEIWDVASPFGSFQGDVSVFFTASSFPLEPTLALRAGGKHVFGTYPFHEAAFIGGGGLTASRSTVRGFRAERFAGDSALYGNAELRLRLTKIYFFLPGEMGLFGLGDIGRVYYEGEDSKKWHRAVGGGIWISSLKRENCLTVSFAKCDERTAFYVRIGFAF